MHSSMVVSLPSLSNVIPMILTIDFLRYFLAAGLIWLIVTAFRRPLAGRRILGGTPRAGQMRREFTYSLSTVVIFTATGTLIFLGSKVGWFKIYDDVAVFGWGWWWASLALIVVAHDAYFYWTHRWLHHPRWIAAVHSRHHHSLHPTPWAAYAFHPLEAVVQSAFLPLFLVFVPMHPLALALFLVHMILRNAVGHSGHELMPWRQTRTGWLRWITPVTHHHFHHTRNRGNFGLYFTWWDRLCGTEDGQYLTYGDAQFKKVASTAR